MAKLALNELQSTRAIWIPQIPKHWEFIKVRHLFNESTQKGFPNETLLVASQEHGVVSKDIYGKRTVEATKDLQNLKLVEPGDFVISLRSFQGGIEIAYERGIISPAYTVMKAKRKIEKRYFKNLFKSLPFISLMNLCVKGIREGQNIDYPTFKNEFLPFPPIEEQKAIADYLDKKNNEIDKFIRNKERLIELLEEQKANVVNEHIKGIYIENDFVTSENEFIGKMPVGWSLKRLKYIASVKGRIGFRGYTVQDIVGSGEGAITLSPSNIFNHKLIIEENTYLSWKKYYESPEIMIYENDIVFVKTGSTIGKTALIPKTDEKMTLNPQLVVFKKIRINPEFLYFLFTTSYIQKIIELDIIGGAAGTLSQQKTKTIPVFFPDNGKQKLIVSMIKEEHNKIDAAINNAKQEITSIKEYRESLITELVTGKRSVPQKYMS